MTVARYRLNRPAATAVLCLAWPFVFAVLLLALSQLDEYRHYNSVRYWANRLESGSDYDRLIERRSALPLASVSAVSCQSRFAKANLTIALWQADVEVYGKDRMVKASALETLENVTHEVLSCLPTDGNAWARLAMVLQAKTAEVSEITRYLLLSQLYQPVEVSASAARCAIYERISARDLELIEASLSAEINGKCAQANRREH